MLTRRSNMDKEHLTKKWEISIMKIENTVGKKYKVTKHLADLSVSETKVFRSKEEAKKQFNEWLK
jgi:ribosomal protein L14E/L6E/L27E